MSVVGVNQCPECGEAAKGRFCSSRCRSTFWNRQRPDGAERLRALGRLWGPRNRKRRHTPDPMCGVIRYHDHFGEQSGKAAVLSAPPVATPQPVGSGT